jgi:hypothetical protein
MVSQHCRTMARGPERAQALLRGPRLFVILIVRADFLRLDEHVFI